LGYAVSLNRYSYVLNRPFRFTDPSGMEQCDPAVTASCPHYEENMLVKGTRQPTPQEVPQAELLTSGGYGFFVDTNVVPSNPFAEIDEHSTLLQTSVDDPGAPKNVEEVASDREGTTQKLAVNDAASTPSTKRLTDDDMKHVWTELGTTEVVGVSDPTAFPKRFDKLYGYSRKFWRWAHKQLNQGGKKFKGQQISKEEASDLHDQWKASGEPGPDGGKWWEDILDVLPGPLFINPCLVEPDMPVCGGTPDRST
jgi:hypothetical protein